MGVIWLITGCGGGCGRMGDTESGCGLGGSPPAISGTVIPYFCFQKIVRGNETNETKALPEADASQGAY